ncbi:unnamed protein product [Heterobilharzia americana]|nr:unnamed protein product [Heterobilharzia americana]CAH8654653.1 unnamed protein product [Heterobilharzia americana]
MLHQYMLALMCFLIFTYIHKINATDDNFVSYKDTSSKLSPAFRGHVMKRNYLWDARLGKRSMNTMNRDSYPWYKYIREPYYVDDSYFRGYPGYDD